MTTSALADHVLYASDFEGSRLRLADFYANSGGFYQGRDGKYHLQKGITFVYGGDVPDRYLGSIHLVEELNRHFDENPGRVHLIAGNRDINKMRFTNELSDEALTKAPFYGDRVKAELIAEETELPPDRARRMKFILARTMGAPNAFELLRREIAGRGAHEVEMVSDDEVVTTYLDLLSPRGEFTKLLGRMELGVRFGETIIVHGGLTRENIGATSVEDWLAELNTWYRSEFRDWVDGYMKWSGVGPRFGEDLIEYPMPLPGAPSKPESVVTGRHVDQQNNPLLPHERVIEFLRAQDVFREIVGHTPIGDMAVVARNPEQTFESIFADNSYSSKEDNATWIWLTGDRYQAASIRGRVQIMPDEWREIRAETVNGQPTPLGQLIEDGSRILGFDFEGNAVATRMRDHVIQNRRVSCSDSLGDRK